MFHQSSPRTNRGGRYKAANTSEETPTRGIALKVVTRSPFFEPTDPRKKRPVSTPGGTVHLKKVDQEPEHKSTILGASANLIVSIVGAGIVGVPYAIQQSGLVAGLIMTLVVAGITEKSLRLLIETAKHIDVPSYEVLYEASFGYGGFLAMSLFMFSMSYGAMLSYMLIMKDSISYLVGVGPEDVYMRRSILLIVTLVVLFPLSSQRDMADLAKTSRISVTFYMMIVLFVVVFSPVQESVQANGGWKETISSDIIRPQTFFTGLGVLSFAYVCQHSSFIIAGSLKNPTKERWAFVSGGSLLFSGTLAFSVGSLGYLGFGSDTKGNILDNFEAMDNPTIGILSRVVRVMLIFCMFFVYPMDAFVQRHIYMVLLFKGRRAHEGDDHAVLARRDRRLTLTAALIGLTLTPALLLEDLGNVLAVTGSIAGSFLSYIAPGTAYLAVHGEEFLSFVGKHWTWGNPLEPTAAAELPAPVPPNRESLAAVEQTGAPPPPPPALQTTLCGGPLHVGGRVVWWLVLMPVWTRLARIGQRSLERHFQEEALKSPHATPRLGKVAHKKKAVQKFQGRRVLPPRSRSHTALGGGDRRNRALSDADQESLTTTSGGDGVGYGTLQGTEALLATPPPVAAASSETPSQDKDVAESDPQADEPGLYDFAVAIGLVVFGIVSLIAGMISIF